MCDTPIARVTGCVLIKDIGRRLPLQLQCSYQGQQDDFSQSVRGNPYIYEPVAPVAYQVILEPGIGLFREFESPRVHTRINSYGLFLVHNLSCGKRESVSEQQHSMKNRPTLGLLNPRMRYRN